MLFIVHLVINEAQETRRAALARQDEADGERLSYEERVELAEDVLIVCFHTVAPPDRRVCVFFHVCFCF